MLEQKLDNLKQRIVELKRVVVAFSGGVDSTFLLKVCMDVLGRDHVLAVTAHSEAISEKEFVESQGLANLLNAKQIIIQSEELNIPAFPTILPKDATFANGNYLISLLPLPEMKGHYFVVEGSNFSDAEDFRPEWWQYRNWV